MRLGFLPAAYAATIDIGSFFGLQHRMLEGNGISMVGVKAASGSVTCVFRLGYIIFLHREASLDLCKGFKTATCNKCALQASQWYSKYLKPSSNILANAMIRSLSHSFVLSM